MKIAGKKILITGGAGFIGSHIADSLVKENAEVIILDNFSSGRKENLHNIKKDVEVVRGDILNYKAMLKLTRDVDIVSHQAAQLEIFRCIKDPVQDLETNTIGSLNVLKAAVENNVQRIIIASSACVYGQAKRVPQPEDHPKNPNWAYGVSKLAVEKYSEIFQDMYNIPIVNLRYGITYGEREWFGRVLTIFIHRALIGKPLVIFGNGKQLRDFVYVIDVVEAHNNCIKTDSAVGAYNVGTGIKTDINTLAELVKNISGKELRIFHEDVKEGEFSKYVKGRRRIPSELKAMVLDISKAKKELNWEPKVNLSEGIEREMGWINENPNFWKTGEVIKV
jgi:UDP-glucose 4-epimerase